MLVAGSRVPTPVSGAWAGAGPGPRAGKAPLSARVWGSKAREQLGGRAAGTPPGSEPGMDAGNTVSPKGPSGPGAGCPGARRVPGARCLPAATGERPAGGAASGHAPPGGHAQRRAPPPGGRASGTGAMLRLRAGRSPVGRRGGARRGDGKMAVAGGGSSRSPEQRHDPLSRFTCPVCLEVFESPVRVPCGHV